MLFVLFFAIIFAILGAYFANKSCLDPALWGIICFLFGIFGMLALLIAIVTKGDRRPEEETKINRKRKK